jgi:hypothetical protein
MNILFSLILGWLLPLVVFAFGIGKWLGIESSGANALWIWCLGTLCFVALWLFRDEIQESRERMKDPQYQVSLKQIGLLDK